MNNTLKTIGISALVAFIVTGAIWLALPAKTPIIGANAVFGNTSIDGSQANLPNPSNSDYEVARLAFGLGTNLSVSSTGAGNVNTEAQRVNITAASTTLCAIQNPFNSTSTLQEFTMNVTVASSTATSLVIGSSTSAFSPAVSPFFGATLAANSQGTFMAGETASSTGLGVVLGPTAWMIVTTPTAQTLGGTCSGTFVSI